MFEVETNKSYLNNEIRTLNTINKLIKFKDIDIFATLENNNKVMRVFNI